MRTTILHSLALVSMLTACSNATAVDADPAGQGHSRVVTSEILVIENVTGPIEGGGTFTGSFTITEFAVNPDGTTPLVASGTLVGTVEVNGVTTQISTEVQGVALTLIVGAVPCNDINTVFFNLPLGEAGTVTQTMEVRTVIASRDLARAICNLYKAVYSGSGTGKRLEAALADVNALLM